MALIIVGSIEIGRPDNECKLKIGMGVGSQHLFLKNEYGDFFRDIDDFFFCRQDLINYLYDAKEEYFNPSENYHLVRVTKKADIEQGITTPTISIPVNLKQYWYDLMQEVESLDDILYLGFVKGMDNDNAGRFYYHNDSSNSPYSILHRMCIPTKQARTIEKYRTIYKLVKIQDTIVKKKYIHIIPIFNMTYSIEQLSSFLKRDYPIEAEKQKSFIFDFFFKYAIFIKTHNYSLKEIIEKTGLEISYLNELEAAVDSFSKSIPDVKNIYHLFASSERVYVDDNNSNNLKLPLQQIFFGAPGTGKSHAIKDQTNGKSVIRTTFHPDSDYSTFVGCYKPSIGAGRVYGAQGPLTENGKPIEEHKITYKYVIQAFLKAYLGAWKKYTDREGDEVAPQFLIIEEINRGNCAQVFGDLFQLLDRGRNGFSEYPIEADNDLQKEIERAFKEEKDGNTENSYKLAKDIEIEGVVEGYTSNYEATLSEDVQHGRVLLLPKNLYIWATMNTSDQSLFPIDSAFKRRWDWEYMPIGYKNENWTIEIGEKKYKWVDFQREINDKIYSIDNSEDKQLGDYFVNADRTNNVISSETLLNKILFYLWNDVCKDDPDQIFRWKDDKDNNQEKGIKFSDFFCEEKERKLQGFMAFLGINANEDAEGKEEMNDDTTAGNDDVVNS